MIDCFPFFNELDVLEVRLHTLAPYVDRFVLAECSKTHSGNTKALYFDENKDRFEEFNILHVIIPAKIGEPWDLEAYGREVLLNSIGDTDSEEIILISDVDEIPDLSEYSRMEGVFSHKLYCYRFNFFTGLNWRGTFAIKKKNIGRHCIEPHLRNKHKRESTTVGKGWHFSWIGNVEQAIYKLESFAHQELNTTEYKNKIIENRGKLTIQMPSGPKWLLENKDRYPDLFINEK